MCCLNLQCLPRNPVPSSTCPVPLFWAHLEICRENTAIAMGSRWRFWSGAWRVREDDCIRIYFFNLIFNFVLFIAAGTWQTVNTLSWLGGRCLVYMVRWKNFEIEATHHSWWLWPEKEAQSSLWCPPPNTCVGLINVFGEAKVGSVKTLGPGRFTSVPLSALWHCWSFTGHQQWTAGEAW